MNLTTKGRYGVRAMVDLAFRYQQGFVPVKQLCSRQEISVYYLEQLFSKLRHAGLVESLRGPKGGYRLSRDPKEITAGAIIRVLEDSFAPVECVDEESDAEKGHRINICVTRLLWKDIKDKIGEVLDNTTLEDLCQRVNELPDYNKTMNHHYMYHI